jgi:hypothetical protein
MQLEHIFWYKICYQNLQALKTIYFDRLLILIHVFILMFCFSGETATCMYNSPHEDESLPRVLPGKLLSLDAQCRKDRGTSACFKV